MSDQKEWNEGDFPQGERWVEYDLTDLDNGNPEQIVQETKAEDSAEPQAYPGGNANGLSPKETPLVDNNALSQMFSASNQPKRNEVLMRASQLDGDPDDELERRDYRPVRFRRDGRLGCLGGLMYAVFIISVSIILACLGWMAASDVLALNKEPLVAMVEIPRGIFTDKEVVIENDDASEDEKTEIMSSADISFVAGYQEFAILISSQGLLLLTWGPFILFYFHSIIPSDSSTIWKPEIKQMFPIFISWD